MSDFIPEDFIQKVLEDSDIVSLVDSYVPLKRKGKDHWAQCPFCDDGSNPSFSVSDQKQFYYCFGCSAGGNAINFLMEHDKLTFMESVEDLAENLGMILPKISCSHASCSRSCVGSEVSPGEQKTNTTQVQFTLLDKIMKFYGWSLRQEEGKVCVDYLKGRGISGDLAKKFQLGWVGGSWDNKRDNKKDNKTSL